MHHDHCTICRTTIVQPTKITLERPKVYACKYAVAILEEEVNLVIRVMWAFKVSLRDHTMNALIGTFCNTLKCVFNAI